VAYSASITDRSSGIIFAWCIGRHPVGLRTASTAGALAAGIFVSARGAHRDQPSGTCLQRRSGNFERRGIGTRSGVPVLQTASGTAHDVQLAPVSRRSARKADAQFIGSRPNRSDFVAAYVRGRRHQRICEAGPYRSGLRPTQRNVGWHSNSSEHARQLGEPVHLLRPAPDPRSSDA
jgi:hypothetical protein